MKSNKSKISATIANFPSAAIAHVVGRGANLTYKFVNDRYAALYGRVPANVIGRHPQEILGEDLFTRSFPNMEKALSGERVTFDLELSAGRDDARLVHVTYEPDVDASQEIVGFVGIIADAMRKGTTV